MHNTLRKFSIRLVNNRDENYAIGVPKDFVALVKETRFTVELSGGDLIFRSGADVQLSSQEIKAYKFEDARI